MDVEVTRKEIDIMRPLYTTVVAWTMKPAIADDNNNVKLCGWEVKEIAREKH